VGDLAGDDGASGIEYGLLIAAVAAILVGVVFVLGQIVHDEYKTACTNLHSQMAGDNCPP